MTTVIDVNPDVLRQSAEAALHAARQSWAHFNAELEFETLGQVETVMATLVPDEPYSFTSSGEEDGGAIGLEDAEDLKPWVAVTRDSVFKHYSRVHGTFVIEGFDPLLELRGNWYSQFESLTTLGIKGTGQSIQMINLVLLASGAGTGITGEISAVIDPEATRAAAKANGVNLEQQRYERTVMHKRYLQALLDGDVDGVLDVMGVDAQSLVRDYVDDTGTLVNLDGDGRASGPLRGIVREVPVRQRRHHPPGLPGFVPLCGSAVQRDAARRKQRIGEARVQHRPVVHLPQGRRTDPDGSRHGHRVNEHRPTPGLARSAARQYVIPVVVLLRYANRQSVRTL